jgi:cystathionine gamma-lyase/homocysteine desulfhydrase
VKSVFWKRGVKVKFLSKLIHGGTSEDPHTGAVSVPIYQASTYRQQSPGVHLGYEYSRTGNPTRAALEALIAELEEGLAGFAFASGMAAISTVLLLFRAGDHLVVSDDVYGGTYRVLEQVFKRFGLSYTAVDTSQVDMVAAAIKPHTRAVFIESPTNPLLRISDIEAIRRLAREHGLLTIVDNTFLTPYLQQPLVLGADIVLHSATKYLGGHSDLVAGLVVVKSEELKKSLHFLQNAVGAVLAPQDSWLLMRGIKTLGVRMDRHEANAQQISRFLADHPQVTALYYPGLPTHGGHEVMQRQARGFGAMLSFEVATAKQALGLLSSLKLITLAESLGGVESLISLPAAMTHAAIPAEQRERLGISDRLIRLSVGIEDVEDIKADLAAALEGV